MSQAFDWNFIYNVASILFGVVGGSWGLYKHFSSKQRKELSYSIIANTPLASVYEELPILHKIKITVGEKNVKNIRFVLIRIQNTGNVQINAEDFELPVCFVSLDLLKSNTLIGGYIAESVPHNALASVVPYEDINMVGLGRFTINKGERVDVALLFADYNEQIIVTSHIKGGVFKYLDVLKPNVAWWAKGIPMWTIFHLFLSTYLSIFLSIFLHVNYFKSFVLIFLSLFLGTIVLYLLNKLRRPSQS